MGEPVGSIGTESHESHVVAQEGPIALNASVWKAGLQRCFTGGGSFTAHSSAKPAKPALHEEVQDFCSAAQNALEVACQGLVSEHERVVAAREAGLRLEISFLRKELSALRSASSLEALGCEVMQSREVGPFSCEALDTIDTDPPQRDSRLRAKSLSHTVSVSACSEEGPITWKRAADSVINKAGLEFVKGGEQRMVRFERFGWAIRLLRDQHFQTRVMETVMGVAIMLNTVTLGLNTEFCPECPAWIVVNFSFAALFTVELAAKLRLLGWRGYVTGPEWRWNDFEVILVLLGWVEVGFAIAEAEAGPSKSSLFRMLRLLRLAKLIRILRLQVLCDLLMMVNGAIGSCKTLLYSMVLICIPLYAVALLLKEMLGSVGPVGPDAKGAEHFTHLEGAFFLLFRCFVANDCSDNEGRPVFLLLTGTYGWGYGVIFCFVQFLMTFGLFNVIVAIYVENTVSAAKFNDLHNKRQRLLDRKYFEEKAQVLLKMIWHLHFEVNEPKLEDFDLEAAGKLQLTQEFFEDLCKEQGFIDILRDLDISEDDRLDLFETLDVEGRGIIGLMEFVVGIGKLRGEARKADIVSVGLMLRSLQHKLHLNEPGRRHGSDSCLLLPYEWNRSRTR